jgi:4-hydroxy-tetrahydrodipicolinate synthase
MPLPAAEDVAADLSQLRAILPADFSVGYSGDWGCASALLAGADCWFSVVGGILPQATMKLTTAARSGDKADTQRINASFEPLWKLFQEFGSFRIVYAIANLLELTEAKPHLPILPLQAADVDRVKQALDTLRTEQTD